MRKVKTIIMVFMVLVGYNLIGQTFGVKGGFNLSNMMNKDNDFKYSEEYKAKPGFNVGVTLDMPITDPIVFQTGIILDTKGYKRNYTDNNIKYEINLSPYYIDIPLHIKYTLELNNIKPYLSAGPYLGVGVSGKVTQKTIIAGISSTDSEAINWGNDDNANLKQFDGGIDFGAGLEFGNIYVGAEYSLGLANICVQPDNGQKINNRLLSISIGYRFVK